jgi:RNA polymerase sigma factor (sigma-70 family)
MPTEQTTLLIQNCLDRLGQGDAKARDTLIEVACGRLQALAHHMLAGYPCVQGHEQTDDVLQNALMRLCRALGDAAVLGQMQTARDFFRLAAVQLRRELIDLARHYRASPLAPAGLPSETSGAGAIGGTPGQPGGGSSLDPARLAAWTELHERVRDLPEEEQEVFNLLWYQGLTQPEAAAVLAMPERTLKRRWQSARRRLYDLLGGELPF